MVSKVKAKGKVAKAPAIRKGRTSTSRISSKNQITIPVEILRSTNLTTGDEVEIAINNEGEVVIKKVAPLNPFQALADAMGDTYVGFDLEKERAYSWD